MLPSLAILNILTDAAAASAAEDPMHMRVYEIQHTHEAALEVRGDGDFKLSPASARPRFGQGPSPPGDGRPSQEWQQDNN